jgi:hypothetical protein
VLQRQDSPWTVILDSYSFGEAIGPRRARTLQGRSAIKASNETTDLGWGGATVSIAIHTPSSLGVARKREYFLMQGYMFIIRTLGLLWALSGKLCDGKCSDYSPEPFPLSAAYTRRRAPAISLRYVRFVLVNSSKKSHRQRTEIKLGGI